MAKKVGLLDEVLGRLTEPKRRRWIDGVPADIREELVQLQEQYRDGAMGRVSAYGIAAALVESLAARGLAVHQTTVVRWLKN
jgi:hypothetical protein